MDDYSVSTLIESKNEWCSRLVNIFTPCIVEGLKSIFNEAYNLCRDNDEESKYLMTFQNFLSRIPKWNQSIIEVEKDRITNTSGCSYIEDLITCVHIIQLKALTCARVGLRQKKVDINIPSVDSFVHKIYINVARKLYTNIYLFEKDIMPLQIQKNNRELEIIIKECILNSVRENIPIEEILRAYLDETEEQDVRVEESNEVIKLDDDNEVKKDSNNSNDKIKTENEIIENIVNKDLSKNKLDSDNEIDKNNLNERSELMDLLNDSVNNKETNQELSEKNILNNDDNHDITVKSSVKSPISFSDTDIAYNSEGKIESINAPKTLERLSEIAELNNIKRKEEMEEDDISPSLNIGENLSLNIGEINDLTKKTTIEPDILLSDIEVLP